jgi:dUTP pyrophosphatase
MEAVKIKIKKLYKDSIIPNKAFTGDSGMDVYAYLSETCVIKPGQWAKVPCGFSMAIPIGWEAQIRPRSGLAVKKGLTVLNAPGTIDAGYRGEVAVILINHSMVEVPINHQDKIAQMCIAEVIPVELEEVTSLDDSDRGSGGFGSSGS